MIERKLSGIVWKSALLTLTVFAVSLPAVVYERGRVVAAAWEHRLQHGGERIELDAITAFRWTRVHLFGPYTSEEAVQQELGFRWQGFRRSAVGRSDSVVLVVFVEGERVVHWFDQARAEADFLKAIRPGGYGPEDAVFRRERHGDRIDRVRESESLSEGLPGEEPEHASLAS
ncbi:MAG TPA: hypothetical protein VMN36_18825 [Verrucomicrobiales bacterium]|nr:hypothetical protein [Verrucomicrobiales bacterium]